MEWEVFFWRRGGGCFVEGVSREGRCVRVVLLQDVLLHVLLQDLLI